MLALRRINLEVEMRRWGTFVVLLGVLVGSSAFALGFSVRGALWYFGQVGLEAEAEYADQLDQHLTWGVRASFQGLPLSSPVLIIPNGFLEYRQNLFQDTGTTLSGYGKLELGIGEVPQFFPRAVLTAGADGRMPLTEGIDGFAQASTYFDFIVTNRARLGVTGRVGAIIIPFVPYVGAEYYYDFYPQASVPKVYAGSLLYLSRQFFVGLEGGFDPGAFVRLIFQFSER